MTEVQKKPKVVDKYGKEAFEKTIKDAIAIYHRDWGCECAVKKLLDENWLAWSFRPPFSKGGGESRGASPSGRCPQTAKSLTDKLAATAKKGNKKISQQKTKIW